MARIVVLDACVLINLSASGEIASIVSAFGEKFVICEEVAGETLYVRSDDAEADPHRVEVEELIEEAGIDVMTLDTEEEKELFVELAAELDDGEAMSMALALERDLALATDDRKARRIFGERLDARDRLISTPQILKRWADAAGVDDADVVKALSTIQRPRYLPGRDVPEGEWWLRLLQQARESQDS